MSAKALSPFSSRPSWLSSPAAASSPPNSSPMSSSSVSPMSMVSVPMSVGIVCAGCSPRATSVAFSNSPLAAFALDNKVPSAASALALYASACSKPSCSFIASTIGISFCTCIPAKSSTIFCSPSTNSCAASITSACSSSADSRTLVFIFLPSLRVGATSLM